MAKKRALIVGINYPGSSKELRGCVNDANMINSMLRENFGFTDIHMLLDNKATTAKMLSELNWLVSNAKPGDVLYFHYSGHGSQLLDENGDEKDGLDEIICPVDLDWDKKVITDDQLKAIFDKVPNGVNLTVTLDCCNSGSGLDQNNQYQAVVEDTRAVQKAEGRYLPPPKYTEEQLKEGENRLGFKKRALQRNVDSTGLLLSACQAQQTSADAFIDGGYIGACTYYLNETLEEYFYNLNYKDLVDILNNKLAKAGYTQRPELNGSARLFNNEFLAPTGTVGDPVVVEAAKPTTSGGKKKKDDKKKGNKTILLVVAALAVAAIAFGMSGD